MGMTRSTLPDCEWALPITLGAIPGYWADFDHGGGLDTRLVVFTAGRKDSAELVDLMNRLSNLIKQGHLSLPDESDPTRICYNDQIGMPPWVLFGHLTGAKIKVGVLSIIPPLSSKKRDSERKEEDVEIACLIYVRIKHWACAKLRTAYGDEPLKESMEFVDTTVMPRRVA